MRQHWRLCRSGADTEISLCSKLGFDLLRNHCHVHLVVEGCVPEGGAGFVLQGSEVQNHDLDEQLPEFALSGCAGSCAEGTAESSQQVVRDAARGCAQ